MKALYIIGAGALEDETIRRTALRIPEVSIRLRQAQKAIDLMKASVDVFNILNSDNESYRSFSKYRNLISAIVQIGLIDRYKKNFGLPSILVEPISNVSVLSVITGSSNMDSLVADGMKEVAPTETADLSMGLPVLSRGVTNCHFRIITIDPSTQEKHSTEIDAYEKNEIYIRMMEQFMVTQIISVGPSNQITSEINLDEYMDRIQIVDSVELDPLLHGSGLKQDLKRFK